MAAPIGFEGVSEPKGEKTFDVQIDPSTPVAEDAPSYRTFDEGAHGKDSGSEEIKLLERSGTPVTSGLSEEKKKEEEESVFCMDGVRRIDFVLTYQETVEKKKGREDTQEKKDKRQKKRQRFLESCVSMGLEWELQDCSESPDRKTFFIKVHGTREGLLKGADELLIRMPIKENNLKKSSFREQFFDCIHVSDPFQPTIPTHLELDNYFTAPFKIEAKENFIGWQNDDFFNTGKRGAIVYNLMQNARYGEDEDQIGLARLLQNKSFTSAYPLHESKHKVEREKGEELKIETDRQLLYHQWSYWTNWYKVQPVNHIRKYFGEKVGIYFTWLGFYTAWLLPASIVGLIVLLYGFSTIPSSRNTPAADICNNENRETFYMCPQCDTRCDFWYLRDTCGFAHVLLLFDNGATVFFAIFMAFWAVLFLEFWKRRQFYLQYDWDMLGFEEAEERARPEFEQKIKRYIRKCKTEKARQKFYVYNPVLEKNEYIQPTHWFLPKIVATFSILITMVSVVIAVVFCVLLYRIGVGGAIYTLVSGIPGGPSVADIVVSVTGACLQLVAIIVLNKVYEYLALILNNWELHRTSSDYEDSFITKMYLFQFFNFYSSLFYVAYFKGNFVGNPGDYQRIGGLRLDECATYGCLLELTIQLAIIFLGKQVLNNFVELGFPYFKRIWNWIRHKETTEADVYTRWEKDYDLIPINQHGLFSEYLELVIQYGFVTLFVAAFPLAPFFALLNNWVEIRLDAHKYVVVFRRTISERAQDIGAWYAILDITSKLAVVTNAFLIAVTAQFVPFEIYTRGDYNEEYQMRVGGSDLPELAGYVNWSVSPFRVEDLFDGRAFPALSALELSLFNGDDEVVAVDETGESPLLYLPFIDFECLREFYFVPVYQDSNGTMYNDTFTEADFDRFINNGTAVQYVVVFNDTRPRNNVDRSPTGPGICFNRAHTCRFRGLVEEGGFRPVRYWQSWTARLSFVILFEHFIFVISGFLAWLVPDVPQSVKNEIQREKLLASEAIHALKATGKEIDYTPSPEPLEEGGF